MGATLPRTGRGSLWGKSTEDGLSAAVTQLTTEGLPLRILVRDDGDQPLIASANVVGFISEDMVNALVCLRDGPTIDVAAAAARANGTPVVGVGGEGRLRQPLVRSWFGVRAPQAAEGLMLARELVQSKALPVLVLLSPGAESAEFRRGMERLGRPADIRFADPIARQDWISLLAGVRSVVFDLDSAAAAAEIKRLETTRTGADKPALRVLSSRSTPEHVARAVGSAGAGIGLVLPLPAYTDENFPLARSYRAAMGAKPQDMASWEAFVTMRILAEGLRRTSRDYTPGAVLAALETVDADLGGLRVRLSSGSHDALDRVWFGRLEGGRVVATEHLAQ